MSLNGKTLPAVVEIAPGFYPRGLAWLEIKEKYKRGAIAYDESIAALETMCGMFEYEDLPESVDTDFLELYLMTEGMASIRKDNSGNYVAMRCSEGSDPNAYGLGEKIISTTANGQTFEDDRDGKEVAFGYNNNTKTACTEYFKLGADLAEIDTSLDFLVWYSRVSRLYAVADEKQRTMIETAFKNLKKGVPLTVVSDNLISAIENGGPGLTPFDLTDADYADKIMRLCEYREARIKWFMDRYGMAKRTVSKKAQVSKDEANGDTAASLIIPLNMLSARERFIKMCNDRFGWNASVHFKGAYLGEIERYEDTVVENAALDIDNYEAVKNENPETPEPAPEAAENVREEDKPDDDNGKEDN